MSLCVDQELAGVFVVTYLCDDECACDVSLASPLVNLVVNPVVNPVVKKRVLCNLVVPCDGDLCATDTDDDEELNPRVKRGRTMVCPKEDTDTDTDYTMSDTDDSDEVDEDEVDEDKSESVDFSWSDDDYEYDYDLEEEEERDPTLNGLAEYTSYRYILIP